jgi:hypothetical protein
VEEAQASTETTGEETTADQPQETVDAVEKKAAPVKTEAETKTPAGEDEAAEDTKKKE